MVGGKDSHWEISKNHFYFPLGRQPDHLWQPGHQIISDSCQLCCWSTSERRKGAGWKTGDRIPHVPFPLRSTPSNLLPILQPIPNLLKPPTNCPQIFLSTIVPEPVEHWMYLVQAVSLGISASISVMRNSSLAFALLQWGLWAADQKIHRTLKRMSHKTFNSRSS